MPTFSFSSIHHNVGLTAQILAALPLLPALPRLAPIKQIFCHYTQQGCSKSPI